MISSLITKYPPQLYIVFFCTASTCLFSLDCKALVIPTDGSLDTTDVKEGTIVTTTCNTGYTLIGLSTVECLPRGKWNRYLPFCHRGRIICCDTVSDICSTGKVYVILSEIDRRCLHCYSCLQVCGDVTVRRSLKWRFAKT